MRGDIVVVSAPGDYGKPRPAVVIQSDLLTSGGLGSTIVCLITSDDSPPRGLRVDLEPSTANGLRRRSQIMVEKLFTLEASKANRVIGHLDDETMLQLDRTLAFVIGIVD